MLNFWISQHITAYTPVNDELCMGRYWWYGQFFFCVRNFWLNRYSEFTETLSLIPMPNLAGNQVPARDPAHPQRNITVWKLFCQVWVRLLIHSQSSFNTHQSLTENSRSFFSEMMVRPKFRIFCLLKDCCKLFSNIIKCCRRCHAVIRAIRLSGEPGAIPISSVAQLTFSETKGLGIGCCASNGVMDIPDAIRLSNWIEEDGNDRQIFHQGHSWDVGTFVDADSWDRPGTGEAKSIETLYAVPYG